MEFSTEFMLLFIGEVLIFEMCLNEPAVNQNSLAIEWCILCMISKMPIHKGTVSKVHLETPETGTEWCTGELLVCAAGVDILVGDVNVTN
jgi:hypothetical protein